MDRATPIDWAEAPGILIMFGFCLCYISAKCVEMIHTLVYPINYHAFHLFSEGQCSFKGPFATPALPGDGHPQHCKVPEQHWRMARKRRPMDQGEAQPPKIRRTNASTHEN